MDVPRLRRKRRAARQGRKRQLRLFRRTGDVGHRKRAGVLGRHSRKLTKLLKRALSIAPGPPAWGGSKRQIRERVAPIVARHGIARTSAKRSETFGNPGSDHFIGNVLAYAEDYATGSNFALAQEIRSELQPGADHQDFEEFFVEGDDGHTYRFQIIAATHGTGPHLHVGCERVD